MNRALLLLPLCLGSIACRDPSGGTPRIGDAPLEPLRLPACFRLTYAEWGLPPRADGQSLRNAKAPIAFQLRDDLAPRGFRDPEDTATKLLVWVQRSDDSLSATGSWKPSGGDSLALEFPFMPGLYGMTGTFARRGDLLVGEIRTYSDVIGAAQGTSRVIALPLPCTFPRLAPDPFAEDSTEEDSPPSVGRH